MPRASVPEYDTSEQFGRMPRRRFSALQAIGAVFVALIAGACLGSGSLVNLAKTQPVDSSARDVALPLARANDRLARTFLLDTPAQVVDGLSGDGGGGASVEDLLADQATPTPTPPPTSAGVGATPRPTPTPTPVVRRTVTAEEPLRLYVGGDSMARELGAGVAAAAPADLVVPTIDFQNGRGLSRPDALDWPRRLASVVSADAPPDVVIMMFGANDFQAMTDGDGNVVHYENERGSPAWLTTYRERVGLMMDLLDQPGLSGYWVGLPVVRDAIPDSAVVAMNQIYREQAEQRPWMTFVDVYDLFAGPDGTYADVIDGELMRQDDGLHWSIAGANRVGPAVWTPIAEAWNLGPG